MYRNFVSVSIGNATTIYVNDYNQTKMPHDRGAQENENATEKERNLLMLSSNSIRKRGKTTIKKEAKNSDYSDTIDFPNNQVTSTTEKTTTKMMRQSKKPVNYDPLQRALLKKMLDEFSFQNSKKNLTTDSKEHKEQNAKDTKKKSR